MTRLAIFCTAICNGTPMQLYFCGFTLDLDARELSRGDETIPIETRTFDLIAYLAAEQGRVATKEAIIGKVWDGRSISDSALASQINAARRLLGDDGKTQRIIKTVHGRGFRFNVEVASSGSSELSDQPPRGPSLSNGVRYCHSPDGACLAYATTGNGPPLVRAASFLTHLQFDFDSVLFNHWVRDFSQDFQYIRYDQRGNGLSDWIIDDFSFESMIVDLETVVADIGLEKFALLGSSQGASLAIAFAHRHPELVSSLVIYDGYASGFKLSDDQDYVATRNAMLELTRASWGKPNPVGRQAYSSLFMPDATTEQHAALNKLQQITTTPDNAYEILKVFSQIDVRSLLPEINVPTLVLHRREDAVVPFEAGRLIARTIPNSKFVPLEGRNHIVLENETEWNKVIDEVKRFVIPHSQSME